MRRPATSVGKARSRRITAVVVVALLCGLLEGCGSAVSRGDPKIAVLGDSISGLLARDIRTVGFNGHPNTRNWTIDGQFGAGWGEGENAEGQWPLSVTHGTWVARSLRALGKDHPAAIVIELGTNDALRADFAAATSNATALANRQDGTEGNIKSDVRLARAVTSCVVLVTPTTYPTKVFGPGTPQTEKLFSEQADRVDELLLQQSSKSPHGIVAIANWAKVSAGHHLPSSDSGNWFSSDELHPNFAGERALASLISRTVERCPH